MARFKVLGELGRGAAAWREEGGGVELMRKWE